MLQNNSAKCGWDRYLPQCYHPGYVKQRKQYTIITVFFLCLSTWLVNLILCWRPPCEHTWTHTREAFLSSLDWRSAAEIKKVKHPYPLIHSSLSTRYECLFVYACAGLHFPTWNGSNRKIPTSIPHYTHLLFLLQHNVFQPASPALGGLPLSTDHLP